MPNDASPSKGAAPTLFATHADSLPYAHDGRAAYWLTYYIVLVTRRRRAFFAEEPARTRAQALLIAAAEALGCTVTCCEVAPASATVHVEAPPTLAPHKIVTRLREDVAGPLKEEFEHIRRAGAVFVRQYLVSTVPLPETDCRSFTQSISTG